RDGAGREARAEELERRHSVEKLAGDLGDEMRDVGVALGLHEALDADGAGEADAREVVAAEVDEHRVLRPVLRGGEQLGFVAAARPDRPGDRVELGAAAAALDDRLRRAADEGYVVELEEEEIRRRVDPPQRAVELDGGGARRPRCALRDDDLEDVAHADVLLRPLDAADVLVPGRLALQRASYAVAARHLRLRPGQGVSVSAQELGDATGVVEADEDVGDEEEALRRVRPVRRQRDGRLEARDRVVAEVAEDRLAELLRIREGDEPRAGSDEAVPPEAAALNRLEEEGAAGVLPQPEVGAERGEEVGRELLHRRSLPTPARTSSAQRTSTTGKRVSASRHAAAKSAVPTSPVNSEWRRRPFAAAVRPACARAWTAKRRARSSQSSSPVRANALRSAKPFPAVPWQRPWPFTSPCAPASQTSSAAARTSSSSR